MVSFFLNRCEKYGKSEGILFLILGTGRAVEEGGAGGHSPPSTIFREADPPSTFYKQYIPGSVKGSLSKIKSPENRQLFMLIY